MNEVTNVQGAHSIAPSFKSAKTESKATTTPQQKENGDKKLMLALAGLAATSAAVIYGVKSGKLQNALSKSKNTTQTVQNAVSQHSIKPQQKAAEAAEAAKETVQNAAQRKAKSAQESAQVFIENEKEEIALLENIKASQSKAKSAQESASVFIENGKTKAEYLEDSKEAKARLKEKYSPAPDSKKRQEATKARLKAKYNRN